MNGAGEERWRVRTRQPPWWLALLAVAVPLAAISGQSFWIDEACTYWKATQPTLARWWTENLLEGGSDLQMPLYQVYMWVWVKWCGTSEAALRAGNVPWLWLGLAGAWQAFAARRPLAVAVVVATLCSPLVWYYLNEARPYAMQHASALLVVGALWRLGEDNDAQTERTWCWSLGAGALALAGSSLLGMGFAGGFVLAALLAAGWRRAARLFRAQWFCWVAVGAGCLALGWYYAWTLGFGARGGTAGRTDIRNVLFVGYELLGFSGLGPSRGEMRGGEWGVFLKHLPWLVSYGVVCLGVFWVGTRRLISTVPRRTTIAWAAVVGGAVVFLFAAGMAMQFRVLGRHFMPVEALLILVLAFGWEALLERPGAGRWLVIAQVLLALVSCAELRFAARHAKDAYREAADLAKAALARGESVWWNAEPRGTQVYRVPATRVPGPNGVAWVVVNPPRGFSAGLPKPDWIIVSKPDLYDGAGAVREYILGSGFRGEVTLPAFVLWRKAK